jgi:hypothetical protein
VEIEVPDLGQVLTAKVTTLKYRVARKLCRSSLEDAIRCTMTPPPSEEYLDHQLSEI